MDCSTEGIPDASITWFKDGELLNVSIFSRNVIKMARRVFHEQVFPKTRLFQKHFPEYTLKSGRDSLGEVRLSNFFGGWMGEMLVGKLHLGKTLS